jgi:hypothetical protein
MILKKIFIMRIDLDATFHERNPIWTLDSNAFTKGRAPIIFMISTCLTCKISFSCYPGSQMFNFMIFLVILTNLDEEINELGCFVDVAPRVLKP